MSNPRIPVPATLKLYDVNLYAFNTKLTTELSWLSFAYGEAQRLTRKTGNVFKKYPAVYAGSNIKGEYVSALPDEFQGSGVAIKAFSYFEIYNKEIALLSPNAFGTITAQASIIFWFNMDKVLDTTTEYRNINYIVDQCLKAIKKANRQIKGNIVPTGWTTVSEEIYRDYSIKESDLQFLMHPYGGVRIDCDMVLQEIC